MRRRSLTHPVVLLALALILGSAAVVLAVWVLPLVLTRHPSAGMSPAARLKAQNAVRTPVIAALAVIGAATITAAYATRSTRLTLEGQLADRYSKAIDQIGADKALDVRIGGIYALERIAEDSPRDHPTVIEVLATYVREHSHEQWPVAEPGAESPALQPWWRRGTTADAPLPPRLTRPDVQAAVTVIGRRNTRRDTRHVNLSRADLPAADLTFAEFGSTDLTGANLTRANLTDTDLTSALLRGARLTDTNLTDANLTDAGLINVDLTGADLTLADLTRAGLIGADLTGARITDTDFTDADLTGAKLTDTDLSDADLTGAVIAKGPVPAGWQRDPGTGRLKRDGTNSDNAPAN